MKNLILVIGLFLSFQAHTHGSSQNQSDQVGLVGFDRGNLGVQDFPIYKSNFADSSLQNLLDPHNQGHVQVCDGFVPKNDLKIPVGAKTTGGVTEEKFNQVLDKIMQVYGPEVQRLGGKLEIDRNWSDSTVNAYATQSSGVMKIHMFGGLARHETVNAEGFALVACHEIGHHIGGAPKVPRLWWTTWATNEGGSDYFATLKCLRRYFADEDNAAILQANPQDAFVVRECEKQYSATEDRLLCMRIAIASKSIANLFAALGRDKMPEFHTPDTSTVSSTNHAHPKSQCRLDTYFSGSLCTARLQDDLSNTNLAAGSCMAPTYVAGLRPRCWFGGK